MEHPPAPQVQFTPTPPSTKQKRRRGLLRDVLETLLVVFIVYFGFRAVALPYEVDGASMSPNLHGGERIFVSRVSYAHIDVSDLWNLLPWEDRQTSDNLYFFDPPQRGDIIVLHPPYDSDEPYIKRVIGLPGETISFRNGSVLIDGVPLTEEYIEPGITYCRRDRWCDFTIPPGMVYVMGDNRQDSTDSRVFGPIAYNQIIGQAIFANWPIDEFGPIDSPEYVLSAS